MIADKNVKYTKNDKIMAFLNVEDLIGNVEVVVFPQVYERYNTLLTEDAKVFIRGRVSLEEDKDGKLICDQIISFEDAQAARAANQPLFPKITEAGEAAAADPMEMGTAVGSSRSVPCQADRQAEQWNRHNRVSGRRTPEPGRKKACPRGPGSSFPIWKPIRPENRNCYRPSLTPTAMTMW